VCVHRVRIRVRVRLGIVTKCHILSQNVLEFVGKM
jgi:hypothetical protein